MDVDLEEVRVHDAAVASDAIDGVNPTGLAVAGLRLNLQIKAKV